MSDAAPIPLARMPWTSHPRRWLVINFVAWFVLALMYALQGAARGTDLTFGRLILACMNSCAPSAVFTPLIASLAIRFRVSMRPSPRVIGVHLLAVLAFSAVAGALVGSGEWGMGRRDDLSLLSAMGIATKDYMMSHVLIYIAVAGIAHAIAYAVDSREAVVRESAARAELAEARLQALSAQLHPHFLFNTLNAIAALVREDPRQAERTIAKLSDLLRHALQERSEIATTLADEIAFIRSYVDIQEARFAPRLRVDFAIDATLGSARVPHMVLQPLVENAIQHGTSRRKGDGVVTIEVTRQNRRIELVVRDNGAGIASHATDGVGLTATRARLRQLFGDEFTLTLSPLAAGTECRVSCPFTVSDG